MTLKCSTARIWWVVEKNSLEAPRLTLGIDASNLRRGGGVTHLVELLAAAEPEQHGFKRVIVWGGSATLAKLAPRPWLEKIALPALDKGLLSRTLWQRFGLGRLARAAKCDVLFVPGGNFSAHFRPIMTMSRNMLPFEWQELRRYGLSLLTLKLLVLRISQSRSLRRADGVIFLTEYARRNVPKVSGALTARLATIPHGLNPRFQSAPKPQEPIEAYNAERPYRLVYVSIIDQYKHQWHVVEAVHALRQQGLPLHLDLVGPAYGPALRRLNAVLDALDPDRQWVTYHGAIPYEQLHGVYESADLGIFASSCENMPNILLETMAAGLPIACSERGPMPEILRDAGAYFDPESSPSIANAIRSLIDQPQQRQALAAASFARSSSYTWPACATHTFNFLANIARPQST